MPGASETPPGGDPVINWMVKNNVPLTRANYLALNGVDPKAEPHPEFEANTPDFLRHPDYRDEGGEG